ncbi:hypothetical protein J8273_6117 [Carpediemonas membranifera]|uniref:Uncharacterized protein n=1 Tax=Carpediemonas membranifera TaxID=201153 RepID=A0A8J6B256_9EUKA|nr:hypothetical protein J8273_6117 [Carpediemonas membranifera]|eukprot:KAG9391367.1 hypothetical protein J8273_6117 [Carpediemonas membranifera]
MPKAGETVSASPIADIRSQLMELAPAELQDLLATLPSAPSGAIRKRASRKTAKNATITTAVREKLLSSVPLEGFELPPFTEFDGVLTPFITEHVNNYVNWVDFLFQSVFDAIETGGFAQFDVGPLKTLARQVRDLRIDHSVLKSIALYYKLGPASDRDIMSRAYDGDMSVTGTGASHRLVSPALIKYLMGGRIGVSETELRLSLHRLTIMTFAPAYYRLVYVASSRGADVSAIWGYLARNLAHGLPALPPRLVGLSLQASDPERKYELEAIVGHEFNREGVLLLFIAYIGFPGLSIVAVDRELARLDITREILRAQKLTKHCPSSWFK